MWENREENFSTLHAITKADLIKKVFKFLNAYKHHTHDVVSVVEENIF